MLGCCHCCCYHPIQPPTESRPRSFASYLIHLYSFQLSPAGITTCWQIDYSSLLLCSFPPCPLFMSPLLPISEHVTSINLLGPPQSKFKPSIPWTSRTCCLPFNHMGPQGSYVYVDLIGLSVSLQLEGRVLPIDSKEGVCPAWTFESVNGSLRSLVPHCCFGKNCTNGSVLFFSGKINHQSWGCSNHMNINPLGPKKFFCWYNREGFVGSVICSSRM